LNSKVDFVYSTVFLADLAIATSCGFKILASSCIVTSLNAYKEYDRKKATTLTGYPQMELLNV